MSIIYLALMATSLAMTHPPQILAPFRDLQECLQVAQKQNAQPGITDPEQNSIGAVFVCLKLVSPV